ncbi:leucine zipper domain-containing protein [Agromyces sp. Soil535]|uniref:leucine zipper domain-containing protein n=1 Tax=Agromyces sp. Soil535 TaxID=1736390 RepID=UPI0035194FD6
MLLAKASGCEVELSPSPLRSQEAFVSQANAALTPRAWLWLGNLIVEEGWKPALAARMFTVSTVTEGKWAVRFRAEGRAGMFTDQADRFRADRRRARSPFVHRPCGAGGCSRPFRRR